MDPFLDPLLGPFLVLFFLVVVLLLLLLLVVVVVVFFLLVFFLVLFLLLFLLLFGTCFESRCDGAATIGTTGAAGGLFQDSPPPLPPLPLLPFFEFCFVFGILEPVSANTRLEYTYIASSSVLHVDDAVDQAFHLYDCSLVGFWGAFLANGGPTSMYL